MTSFLELFSVLLQVFFVQFWIIQGLPWIWIVKLYGFFDFLCRIKLSKVYHFQSHIFVFWSVGTRADWEAFLLSPPSGEDYTVSRLLRLFWSLLLPACYAYVVEYFFATFWGMSMTMWKGISSSFYLYPFCQSCCYWIMFCCNTKLSALSFSW